MCIPLNPNVLADRVRRSTRSAACYRRSRLAGSQVARAGHAWRLRISGIEEQIAPRLEFYNAAVNLDNVRMEPWPDLLLAGLARMRPVPNLP